MEKLSILSKDTFIPLGVVIGVFSLFVSGVVFVTKMYVAQQQFDVRLTKVEDVNVRQDKDIQGVQTTGLVFNEVVKQINEKLDGLKKSIETLESRVTKTSP